MFKIMSFF